jgi:hypothetical protein
MEESSNQTTISTRSVGVRYGLILAVISIVYFLVLTFANIDMTQGVGRWASLLFYVGIIFMAHKYFKDEGNGYMSYGQGLGITFWISLISSLIYGVFFYIYVKFVDAGFVDMIKDKQIEQMQAQGMSDEQIDQAMQMAGAFMSPEAMLIFAIIGGVFIIMLCGLIVTIFTQKKSPETSI